MTGTGCTIATGRLSGAGRTIAICPHGGTGRLTGTGATPTGSTHGALA